MTREEFQIKYRDKFLDFDGAYGAQCVDLIKAYFKEVLVINPYIGNAIDYWNNPPIGFKKISKTLFNHPEPGDLIVFNIGVNGHIGICNWWRWFDLNCFQQNDPIGTSCQFKTYNYNKVLGWLRPMKKVNFKCVVLDKTISDTTIAEAEMFVNYKLMGWSNSFLGFYITRILDKQIVDPTPQTTFTTDEAVPILKALNVSITDEEDMVLAIYANNQTGSAWAYTVLFDQVWPIPFTIIPDNTNQFKDQLLFEVGHALIQCYNKRRGSLPSISNSDNYSGGEQYVKAKVEAVLPHLELYDLPASKF